MIGKKSTTPIKSFTKLSAKLALSISNNFQKIIVVALIATALLQLPTQVVAQTVSWEERGQEYGVDCVAVGTDVDTIQGFMCLLANVMSITLTAIGLAGFVMLVYGSIQWLLSGGSSQAVDSAKKTITFAFVGLVVALASYLMINIIARFTGINIIEHFFIPSSETGLPGETQWDDII